VAGSAVGVAVSGDGTRVYVTGTRSGPVDYATLAYDAATGAQVWSASYNGAASRDDRASGLGVSPDGSRLYVTGTSQESSSPKVIAATTIAYDAATGSQGWIDHFSVTGSGRATAVALNADGSRLFVTGESGAPSAPTTLAYATPTGTRLWSARYTGAAGTGVAVAPSPDGARVFTTGWTAGAVSGAVDYTTLGYDAATGTQSWASVYPSPVNGENRVRAIGVSPDGSLVFVTGGSAGAAGSYDYATLAYRATDGVQAWLARYDGPLNRDDYAYSLAVSPDGARVFVTGTIDQFSDYGTIAYDSGVVPRPMALAVPVDVLPDQCPNRLKLASTETLSVAIAGTAGFDVRSVNPATVRLEGVAPLRSSLSDVTTPYSPYTGKTSPQQCINPGPDGVRDLALKFSIPSVAAPLAGHRAGDVVVLHLTGSLKDGTPFGGEDVVVLE
jgi:DNA-binding beta-propeller fold protein YncE